MAPIVVKDCVYIVNKGTGTPDPSSLAIKGADRFLRAFTDHMTPHVFEHDNVDQISEVALVRPPGGSGTNVLRDHEKQTYLLRNNAGAPIEVVALQAPNFTEVQQAISDGLPVPDWIARTPSRRYQVGWVLRRQSADIKSTPPRKPRSGERMAKALGWVSVSEIINPANADNPLKLVNLAIGSRQGKTVVNETVKAFASGYEAGIPDPDYWRAARGSAGGRSRSEKKQEAARRNAEKAAAKRREDRQRRSDAIRQLHENAGWSARDIADFGIDGMNLSIRTVQRHLRELKHRD